MGRQSKKGTGLFGSKTAKNEAASAEAANTAVTPETPVSKEPRSARSKKKKKKKHILLKILAGLVCLGLVGCIVVGAYVMKTIKSAPEIETDDIYSLLSQTSTIYDKDGNVIENIFGDKKRTIVSIEDIPEDVQNAFIAIEDKTFRTHHGFNIIRIFGAIFNKIVHGGDIGGTSTITQQLARNLYLEDTMSERSLDRKIKEAYYAYLLEQRLTKDQILEAYLNTVNFGSGYGIASAAKDYFDKEVKDLTLAEGAALACMPNAPSYYALILTLYSNDLGEFADKVLYTDGDFSYCWNDRCKGRMEICLDFMLEQGLITQEAHDEAMAVEIKDMVNPGKKEEADISSYFADFVIDSVAQDFVTQLNMDESDAYDRIYNGGLQIYTTLDSQAQEILEKEFDDISNFPVPAWYNTDSSGNIIGPNGNILMYRYANNIESDLLWIADGEYKFNKDGSLTLYADKWLHFYPTTVNGMDDISIEAPEMYYYDENDEMYSVNGAYINIPQGTTVEDEEGNSTFVPYKSFDDDGNVVISAKYMEDFPDTFSTENGWLITKNYSERASLIQPQAAMTIIDNNTGAVAAMIGGRGTEGKKLYNRAVHPRQPGSSIKPISVYSAALQKSFELQAAGKTYEYVDTKYDKQGTKLWGDYITAASIVVDEQMTVNGKDWPKNSNYAYTGVQTFRTALQQSINTCAVKILAQVGIDYAYEHAESFGLTSLIPEGEVNDKNLAALGMGGMSNGVSTLEMASAYSVFVNNGIHKSYYCYDKVLDRKGNTILEPKKTETEVLDPGVAWIMRDVLQTVVSQGIAGNAYISGETVGGKTGTTGSQDDNYDIWFDGFTANYSASLWIGNDVNIALSEMSPRAALLWSRIMSQINGALGGEYSGRPSNVVTASVNKTTEYFTKGTEKNAGAGGKFTEVTICKDTGLLATPDCPNTEKKSGYLFDYNSKSTSSSYFSGTLPNTYCYMHNTDPEKYKVADSDKAELEKYMKEREEEEKKKKAEEEKKKKEEEAKKKAEEEKKKAEEEAKKKAEEEEAKKKAEEAARQAAYEEWEAHREEHKTVWVVDVPYQPEVPAVLYTQEDFDAYVEEHDGEEPSWSVGDEKEPAIPEVPEKGHYTYEPGWGDGEFTYP